MIFTFPLPEDRCWRIFERLYGSATVPHPFIARSTLNFTFPNVLLCGAGNSATWVHLLRIDNTRWRACCARWLEKVLKRFVVAGPQYPKDITWPKNVDRIEHLGPTDHRLFYSQQRFTLNLTRAAMIKAGYSPSVRLFEAAACGVPIISDRWPGIETFFVPGKEILLAKGAEEVIGILNEYSEEESAEIGRRARERVLLAHTGSHRARELEEIIGQVAESKSSVPQETFL